MTFRYVSDQVYEELKSEVFEHSLDWLYSAIQGFFEESGCVERKKIFLEVMERLLREGDLKLAKNGVILSFPIEEQIALFNTSWPENDVLIPDCPEMDFYWWFFDESCPGGAVWVMPDGELYWT
ncbi:MULTISPECIES: DUF596 domain-containing protein [Chromobacterium]|uniref:DUF596 domain-containing protein n=1 Tax=Chromobacterium TaxID=535 RepID=UPI0009BBF3A4|nr:DUF596 domain-containing protein [Chromobacterium violaceum]MBX9346775.1 DUF596 domain-containing protein [Chromobacterium vaccinii]